MPIMNGFEASMEINKMINKKKIPPLDIVALTANIATADEDTCKASGMKYYMTKPVKYDNFKKKLNTLFEMKK